MKNTAFWRTLPWLLLCAVAAIGAYALPIWPDGFGGTVQLQGYVLGWGGSLLKGVSGAVVAYLLTRVVFWLNISRDYKSELGRAISGLGVSIFCGLIGFAVANGT